MYTLRPATCTHVEDIFGRNGMEREREMKRNRKNGTKKAPKMWIIVCACFLPRVKLLFYLPCYFTWHGADIYKTSVRLTKYSLWTGWANIFTISNWLSKWNVNVCECVDNNFMSYWAIELLSDGCFNSSLFPSAFCNHSS